VSASFLTFYFSPFVRVYSRSGGKTNENELKFNNKKRESLKTSRFPHNKIRMESQLAMVAKVKGEGWPIGKNKRKSSGEKDGISPTLKV